MTQYMLSVHSVEGEARDPMTDEQMQQFMEQVGVLEEEMKSAGAWVFGGAPARTRHRHRRARVRRRGADHRRSVRGVEGAPRRLLHHRGRGPRRRARLGVEGHRLRSGQPIEVRPFAARIRGLTDCATSTPRRRSTRPRSAGSSARSPADRWPP